MNRTSSFRCTLPCQLKRGFFLCEHTVRWWLLLQRDSFVGMLILTFNVFLECRFCLINRSILSSRPRRFRVVDVRRSCSAFKEIRSVLSFLAFCKITHSINRSFNIYSLCLAIFSPKVVTTAFLRIAMFPEFLKEKNQI